jgi:hypothetical protein
MKFRSGLTHVPICERPVKKGLFERRALSDKLSRMLPHDVSTAVRQAL